ncbi:MAG: rlx protein [Eubacteriales bacterium]|nr:rlx protein [Eubacteriales bacterium]
MAILKHLASKNADYGEALRYLMFQHDEYTGKPILNGNGKLVPREEYYLDGINCDPRTFDIECKELNTQYHKNQTYNEIKSHHYILSFDPKDADKNGLTGERAQKLGLEYARKNFPGHQALVCTHMDGNNESGNIHVHIIINSLRKFDVEREPFMERSCDSRAGYKHHQTRDYLIHLKQSVMDMCHREHLHQVDLLTPAEKKVTEREYHAHRRGQRNMDKLNKKMISEGIAPRKTKFQTQKDFLRSAIDEAAASARTLEEFQNLLMEQYHVALKISRGRFSYLHPERSKAITGRNLGTHYEEKYLLSLFKENAERQISDNAPEQPLPENATSPSASTSEQNADIPAFIFIKSDLRLVIDLQQCVKAQQSQAYAQKVKLSNLQQMAKTVAYVQEHGYDTQADLQDAFSETQAQTTEMRKALRSTEQKLKNVNEQIHYTGQYLANKSVYSQYLKAKNKKLFRQEHPTEITLYETARKILQERSGGKRLPSMKTLKAEKEKLTALKNSQYEAYQDLRGYEKELRTVCTNVDVILGKDHSRKAEKSLDIS